MHECVQPLLVLAQLLVLHHFTNKVTTTMLSYEQSKVCVRLESEIIGSLKISTSNAH